MINKTHHQVVKNREAQKKLPKMAQGLAQKAILQRAIIKIQPEPRLFTTLKEKNNAAAQQPTLEVIPPLSWETSPNKGPKNTDSKKKYKRKRIPQRLKHSVWQKAQGQCQYVSKQTNMRCSSTYFLEIDHIKRIHHGGIIATKNLQLLCRSHHNLRS